MSKVIERFLKYVKVDTQSCDESTTCPSTPNQLVLAKQLVEELKEIGLKDASVDENGYVMATLPSNIDRKVPTIGFMAHMDTSPEISGANINPQFVENYDGGDIVLNAAENVVLSPNIFPELKNYIGQTIITTDGTTLLGSDDKAGIAEIMTAMEYLVAHPELKHGEIKVGFTPDEEVGRGADHFDVKKFGAEFAYTLDGTQVGEMVFESFNAAAAKITVKGVSVHPGYSKNKMVNAILVANELINMMPSHETPSHTEGYEGFYHVYALNGGIEEVTMQYILRDFCGEKLEKKKEYITNVVNYMNKKYGEGTVILELKDQYRNMVEVIEKNKHVVDIAIEAMESLGITPIINPIRGGTDGSRLSFMGLPTPNIFQGGHNYHGKYEYVPVESMEKAVEVVVRIAELYAQK